ncbi:MAG: hypothetical protein U9N39_07900 [Campylobacterota bacterium]|nr:hypothetical protein [Campylobacterota bacterium]
MKKTTLSLILTALIIVIMHSYMHNSFDHSHDSKCSVYVLEQLFFSADIINNLALLTLFLPFLYFSFNLPKHQLKVAKLFSIRAPPHP